MKRKAVVFDFDKLGKSKTATKKIENYFKKAGSDVSIDASDKVRRSGNSKYKKILITFQDSQTVLLKVKESGDIFEVDINNRATPIKNQDDYPKAVAEIVSKIGAGSSAFQKKQLKAKGKIEAPTKLKIVRPTIIKQKTEIRDNLKTDIQEINNKIMELSA